MSSAKKDFKTEIYFSMRKKDGEKTYDVPWKFNLRRHSTTTRLFFHAI